MYHWCVYLIAGAIWDSTCHVHIWLEINLTSAGYLRAHFIFFEEIQHERLSLFYCQTKYDSVLHKFSFVKTHDFSRKRKFISLCERIEFIIFVASDMSKCKSKLSFCLHLFFLCTNSSNRYIARESCKIRLLVHKWCENMPI